MKLKPVPLVIYPDPLQRNLRNVEDVYRQNIRNFDLRNKSEKELTYPERAYLEWEK